ncbi:MAG: transposase [Candidatus Neomarinimicrobiota bacterium]
MPYREINFLKDTLIHVYNRANGGNLLFRSKSDYEWFEEKTLKLGLADACLIPAYCLMPTHFHFHLKLKSDVDISRIMQRLELAYAKYLNRKYDSHGHVFEGPFKSKPITKESYVFSLCKYIHFNPVKSGLVAEPEDWQYSNYRDVISGNISQEVSLFYGTFFKNPDDYRLFVNDINDDYQKDLKDFLFFEDE